jgi:thiol-disulfide isomerase/thioredoxin
MTPFFRPSRRELLAAAFASAAVAQASEPAPRFSAKTMAGETFNNSTLMGKVVLVEFWTTWCPYCKRDAEPLDDLAEEFGKDGLVLLAVDVGESKKTVKAFLEQNPRRAKVVLMEDTNLAAMFAAKRFPKYALIDREGKVAGEQNGSGGDASLRRLLRKAGLGGEGTDDAPIELRSSPRRTP